MGWVKLIFYFFIFLNCAYASELSQDEINYFNIIDLNNDSYVSVTVYNLMGQTIATIADGYMEADLYNFSWNASDVPSGIYFIHAEASGDVAMQRVMLIK